MIRISKLLAWLVLLLSSALAHAQWQTLEGLSISQLKGLPLLTLQKQAVDWEQYQDRPLLISFWASWCEPCRDEIPLLLTIMAKHPKWTMLLINVAESPSKVDVFLKTGSLSLPNNVQVVLDTRNVATQAWQLKGIPSTYLVTRQGQVQAVWVGALSPSQSSRFTQLLSPY